MAKHGCMALSTHVLFVSLAYFNIVSPPNILNCVSDAKCHEKIYSVCTF